MNGIVEMNGVDMDIFTSYESWGVISFLCEEVVGKGTQKSQR